MKTLLDKQIKGDNFVSFTGNEVQPSKLYESIPLEYFRKKMWGLTQLNNSAVKKEFVSGVNKELKNADSPAYYSKEFDEELSIEKLLESSVASRDEANRVLESAKKDRDRAIGFEDDWNTTGKTARLRVDEAIRYGRRMNLKQDDAWRVVRAINDKVKKYVYFTSISEAFFNEAMRRENLLKEVNVAIDKRDIDELKSLLKKAKVTEMKKVINSAIKTIEDENKAIAEREKALAEAQKKIDNAKTDEEKKKAQDEYNSLLKIGSDASGKVAKILGIPKGAFYIGLGLIIALGGYYAIKKARN